MNKRRSNQKNTKVKPNEKFMLIPQYNKYVNVYNHLPTEPNVPKNGRLVNRIILKKPSEETNGDDPMSDAFVKNMIGSLFGTLDGNNQTPFFMTPETISAKKGVSQTEKKNVSKNIDRSKMEFIEERPDTIEDLLKLCQMIENGKYDIENKHYNIDLQKLKNIKEPLLELNDMIGLDIVKQKIVDVVIFYLQGLDIKNQDMLHTIIDGPPGSGKTEIAHIYSKLLCKLGLLTKGSFKKAKRHDFIGGYLGHTAMKTNKLLEESLGGVLFIDEIYSIGSSEGKFGKDLYSKEFVDLLMEFMSEHKDNFVLVVAGYKKDIESFFLSMNDGLERRFPIHLSIDDYNDAEMQLIFTKKVGDYNWKLTDDAIPESFFEKNKQYFKFYGGDLETFFAKCKYTHSRNLVRNPEKEHRVIDRQDFENGFALFKENPEIKKRSESSVIHHMYS